MNRHSTILLLLAVLLVILFPHRPHHRGIEIPVPDVWNIISGNYTGELGDVGRFIIIENRLPALLTATLAGMALAIAGLLMQTCFNNPLAGPSIMGISSGASLGVALVIMSFGTIAGVWGSLATISGALAGALITLGVILLFSIYVRSADVLLIIGILIGYLSSSAISLLNFFSTDKAVHSFVLWGMGTFSAVGMGNLALFSALTVTLTLCTVPYAKSLNALLFGQRFAENVGVSVGRVRSTLLLLSGSLTAVVTAWCGPIGFIGLAVPHIARMLMASSNHKILIPATALCGALMGLLCQIISVAPSLSRGGTIPVNAITPIIGVPVIIYVLMNRKKLLYF